MQNRRLKETDRKNIPSTRTIQDIVGMADLKAPDDRLPKHRRTPVHPWRKKVRENT